MKSLSSLALLAAAGLISSGAALAADGTINFVGKVTDKTCTITTGTNGNFTVTLPTVSSSTLSAAAETAGRTPFSINLEDCDEGKVATYFEPGSTVDFNTGRLINQAAANAAGNVQLQLLGENNGFLPILATGANGAQNNSQWVDVGDGESADLNYYVEYYATGAATAGEVASSVQYTIIYQ